MKDKSGNGMLKMQLSCDAVMVIYKVRRPGEGTKNTRSCYKISQLICVIGLKRQPYGYHNFVGIVVRELSQLTARPAELDHQFAELRALFHVFEQPVNCGHVIQPSLQNSRHHRADFLRIDELNHLLELLSGAHRGTADVDVLEDSRHRKWHLRRHSHSIDRENTAGLKM